MAVSPALQIDKAPLRLAFETRSESLRVLAEELGVKPTTFRRWADEEGWVRAKDAPPCGVAAIGAPELAEAWRRRQHAKLRRLLERYTAKLENWLTSPDDVSERAPADAERYAKTIIALVRCFSDLDEMRAPRDGQRAHERIDGEGETEDRPDFETLVTTLERRLDQLAAAHASPGPAGGTDPRRA